MMLRKAYLAAMALMGGIIAPAAAFANERHIELPQDKALDFQVPATEIMERINSFHHLLLWVIVSITLFVFALLAYVIVRYNRRANPKPSSTTHNTLLEVIWTAVPVAILAVIAVPSFRLLYYTDVIPKADITVKATGNQWYWSYEYPDYDGLSFDSRLVDVSDKAESGKAAAEISRMLGRSAPVPMHRLLDVDNRVVVPVGKNVHLLVTGADVIHAWTIPAFGVKVDAVPGRMNELWFNAKQLGTFYGQCSELCGKDHAFMPIAVEVVTEKEFAEWLARAKKTYAAVPQRPDVRLALAAAPVAN